MPKKKIIVYCITWIGRGHLRGHWSKIERSSPLSPWTLRTLDKPRPHKTTTAMETRQEYYLLHKCSQTTSKNPYSQRTRKTVRSINTSCFLMSKLRSLWLKRFDWTTSKRNFTSLCISVACSDIMTYRTRTGLALCSLWWLLKLTITWQILRGND
jgi:hypothetical protein